MGKQTEMSNCGDAEVFQMLWAGLCGHAVSFSWFPSTNSLFTNLELLPIGHGRREGRASQW